MGRLRSPDYYVQRGTIIDCAAAAFARLGFAATSISDIAEACGCSRSRLYHYFASKDALLHEILESHVDLLLARCASSSLSDCSGEERLSRAIGMFLQVYAVSHDQHIVMLTCLDALPPERRRDIVAKQRRLIDFVGAILAEIHPAGRNDHLDVMLLFGMMNWTYTWYNPAGPATPADVAARIVRLFLHGYNADSANA